MSDTENETRVPSCARYFDPKNYPVVGIDTKVSRLESIEVYEIMNILPVTIEEAEQIATKIYKVKYLAYNNYYEEDCQEILNCGSEELMRHDVMYRTDQHGKYIEKIKIPQNDLKHKIYNIRKLAEEGYYGPKTSEKILCMESEEIYTMKMYEELNTRGKRRLKKKKRKKKK